VPISSSPFAERVAFGVAALTASAARVLPVVALMIVVASTLVLAMPRIVPAQTLRPKRTLTTGAAPGCDVAPPAVDQNAARNNAEARRLSAAAQEAALVGDQAAARDAYVRAFALNPADERLAYDLARAHEELADTLPAIGAYCRYLALAPAGSESADVRSRLARLVPTDAQQRAEDALVAFRLGLGFLDAREFESAVRAFDEVVRLSPAAPEGQFNRGLARSAAGQRASALADLDAYRATAARVEDRVETARAIDVLRRPVYSPGVAFFRGLLPGFGQFYTARPVRGVIVLAAVAGAAGLALAQQTTEETINYVDPNGQPAPYTVVSTERQYLVPGISAAAGITVLAALEAVVRASRSQRGASILDLSAAPGENGFAVRPTVSRAGGVGFRVSARFR
jgi:tetratricopeptide (TPR) repeat protein